MNFPKSSEGGGGMVGQKCLVLIFLFKLLKNIPWKKPFVSFSCQKSPVDGCKFHYIKANLKFYKRISVQGRQLQRKGWKMQISCPWAHAVMGWPENLEPIHQNINSLDGLKLTLTVFLTTTCPLSAGSIGCAAAECWCGRLQLSELSSSGGGR